MHQFSNIPKAISIGDPSWEQAAQSGLLNLKVRYVGNGKLETDTGHQFINMCSCSYLGLNVHPHVLQSAIDEIKSSGIIDITTSRLRTIPQSLYDLEDQIAKLFSARIISGPTCGVVSQGILPLIAAGVFTQQIPPVVIFDKNAHFSLNVNKAACGDETTVLTCEHNDLNFIEDQCKKNKVVAYVADGTYSMGGLSPIKELLALQEKYGLFLYFDDSHSLSAYGEKGCGYIRSCLPEVTDRTIIAATLSKAFGAAGAIAMVGPHKHLDIIRRFGGGLAWSQYLSSPVIGSVQGSIDIHNSPELAELQNKLRQNIALFDRLIQTPFCGIDSTIRLIILNDPEKATTCSRKIFEKGFYTSAVFFPVVPKGAAGLRIMIRADMREVEIIEFCNVVKEVISQ